MSVPFPAELPAILVDDAVVAALREDLGLAGDITSAATIAPEATATAALVAREGGIVAGLALAEAAFRHQRGSVRFAALAADGDRVADGAVVARVSGNARAILSGERVALNYMQHLSGIATHTARFVAKVAHTGARICCTRKTIPGLRAFEKYAVRCGGGANHRYGLYDAVLIKDNHIAVAGSVTAAIAAARAYVGHLVAIEVEVDSLAQLREALAAEVPCVLLDNFDVAGLREAVALTAGRCRLEASGGVNLDSVAAIAETGVDYVSTSKITVGAPPLDLALDIEVDT
ncbi:MAG TPA: carboxylating nicotinate-nucleotide diphosphorylase [Bauldia sp.]|nr:carboxylating nicotinate-nucleotide diphosphorylase [Bauldia sp.]